MIKICVTGPESSGKTTLAMALAEHFAVPWVPEFAREYLEGLGRPYVEEDLLRIAEGQLEAERRIAARRPDVLVCDTDLHTIRIWSEEKFGRCDPWIMEQCEYGAYDHWLLCRPDMRWDPDPLRENPNDRERLFEVYATMLARGNRPHTIMEGMHMARMRSAKAVIMELLA